MGIMLIRSFDTWLSAGSAIDKLLVTVYVLSAQVPREFHV